MMIIVRKGVALSGMVLCFVSTLLPMLKIPIKGNWNLYQTDAALFFITLIIFGMLCLLFFIRQLRAYRMMTYVSAIWFLISITAVYFKINNYFGWGFADRLLAKTIHMRWGWVLYFIGIMFLLFSTKKISQLES